MLFAFICRYEIFLEDRFLKSVFSASILDSHAKNYCWIIMLNYVKYNFIFGVCCIDHIDIYFIPVVFDI